MADLAQMETTDGAWRPMTLDFVAWLTARAKAPGMRKGARRRESLKAAAAALMDGTGFQALRITEIIERAEVSPALFYVYFSNREEIVTEILTDFLDFVRRVMIDTPGAADLRQAIFYSNLRYIEVFEANPGLMRSVFQLADESPQFAATWRAWNLNWIERVVRALERDQTLTTMARDEAGLTVTALGMMVDALLRLIYVERNPRIATAEPVKTPWSLAVFLTRLWIRALHGDDPDWRPPGPG